MANPLDICRQTPVKTANIRKILTVFFLKRVKALSPKISLREDVPVFAGVLPAGSVKTYKAVMMPTMALDRSWNELY